VVENGREAVFIDWNFTVNLKGSAIGGGRGREKSKSSMPTFENLLNPNIGTFTFILVADLVVDWKWVFSSVSADLQLDSLQQLDVWFESLEPEEYLSEPSVSPSSSLGKDRFLTISKRRGR
jgi:hypothetical protein